jgi:hypothetical protein
MSKASTFFQREYFVYFFAITVSLLLSFWIDYRESVINPDAICYLISAQTVGQSGISGAMHVCGQAKWPFYSVLIYGLVQISHFSYPVAAYVLDALFSALSVVFFIRIAKELGATRSVMWLAALVILLSHEFNSIREYIIRDHGFWAFYLASVLFLLRFFKAPAWQAALGWSISLLIATLFRIEGAIFLLTLPFLILFHTRYALRQRFNFFFMLNLPMLLIGFVIGAWLVLHPQQTLDKLGRVVEVKAQLQHGWLMMAERYQATKASLSEHVLTNDSAKEAGFILFLVLLVWYLISVISNVSFAYGLLVVYAWLRKASPFTFAALLVLGGYLIVNVAITFGFLAERLFLSKRYLVALSLILMCWVPFALQDLIQKWPGLRHRFFLSVVTLFILFSSAGGMFDFGYSKSYIHEAGDWIANNVPANANLYANDYQLMYYSQHFGNSIFEKHITYVHLETIAENKWKQYDYLALRLSKHKESKTASILAGIHLTPIQVFSNKRGDQVAIYKVS